MLPSVLPPSVCLSESFPSHFGRGNSHGNGELFRRPSARPSVRRVKKKQTRTRRESGCKSHSRFIPPTNETGFHRRGEESSKAPNRKSLKKEFQPFPLSTAHPLRGRPTISFQTIREHRNSNSKRRREEREQRAKNIYPPPPPSRLSVLTPPARRSERLSNPRF